MARTFTIHVKRARKVTTVMKLARSHLRRHNFGPAEATITRP